MTKQTRHQHLTWYKTCYDLTASGLMALEVLNDNTGRTFQQREDLVHGSLLVLAELLRCSHAEWERVNRELVRTYSTTMANIQIFKFIHNS
jgi:FKBP12-rapamycin complex-associated protein